VRSSTPSAPPADGRIGPRASIVFVTALVVSVATFVLYRATLLPGVDLGDSGSFQTLVGEPLITPRNGYPLYFAIGAAVLHLTGAEPAYALNLTSALEAALACGLFVAVAAAITGSVAAAAAAALLFAVSYTFWSQAVTAEVYALHLACVLASLLFLLRWERRPTLGRLAAFFAVYALGFGNHLSMILLAPAFVVFLSMTAPRGWRSLVEPRVLALAVALACLGALQYLWNLRTLWFSPQPPDSVWHALRTFWFDVTKSDWRDTMVLQVPASMRADHLAMYWFDLRQQFGVPGVLLALAGLGMLAATRTRYAVLLFLLYIVNVAFAFNYNVGDTHVFYLPSHLVVALLAAAGVAGAAKLLRAPKRLSVAAATILTVYAVAHGYRDFPALDRSSDRRAAAMLDRFTANLDDQRAIFLVDFSWQIANGLSYYSKSVRPEVAVARVRDVLAYAPALIDDNLAGGRTIALTERARTVFAESYGSLFAVEPDPSLAERPLADVARTLAPGTRYALCILKPTRDFALDRQDLELAVEILSGTTPVTLPANDYAVIAGVAGRRPDLVESANVPFTRRVLLDGTPVEIRMESWLSSDTIRRMGFGHVIAAHHHTLIVERGVSFAAFNRDGAPSATEYYAGLFARPERYLIRRGMIR
jgi:hypothetical protein